jgi:hypothetical protein
VGASKWAKQARKLAEQHSDKINAGIDMAAGKAKGKKPAKSGQIDKIADMAKKQIKKKP